MKQTTDDRAGIVATAHAATIRRMIEKAPDFRPDATSHELVAEFAQGRNRMPAFLALCARGNDALPAVREGLQHADWQIRRWCAVLADNFADAELRSLLIPLLRDPKADVRVWAVHSLSCENCKSGGSLPDPVPLLLERIASDDSLRVRRQAVAMLAHHRDPDARVLPVFEKILAEESDRRLRLHAEQGRKRCLDAGIRA